MLLPRRIFGLTCLFLCIAMSHAIAQKSDVYTKLRKAKQDPAFKIQGEYEGEIPSQGMDIGVQIVALGGDKFQARAYAGGLPKEGWEGERLPLVEGVLKDGEIVFQGDHGRGVYKDGQVSIEMDGKEVGSLARVNRKSKTLGRNRPQGP